jgi:hypothetical protein
MKPPKGAFGIAWGTPLEDAVRQLGLTCAERYDFFGRAELQVCRGRVRLLDVDDVSLEIVTRDGGVQAFMADFVRVACDALDAPVRAAFAVPNDIRPISVSWRTGEVLRIEESAAGCRLLVASREPGRELQRRQVAAAFGELAKGLRP